MQEIKIEKGIERCRQTKLGSYLFYLNKLEIGDSFEIPENWSLGAFRNVCYALSGSKDKKFSVRSHNNSYRVWRTK